MNAREIVDWVETRLRMLGITPPGDGDILMIANQEMERVARDLRIPTRYVKDVPAHEPFNLPDEALPGGALFAEQTVENYKIEVLTVQEANQFYPDWEKNATEGFGRYRRRLVIYDPSNVSAPVYPIGFQQGDVLRMRYVMKSRPMVFENPDDDEDVHTEPWNGVMPEFHRVIAQMTVFQIAMMKGDEAQSQKARAFFADAQNDIEKAFNYSRPDYHMPGRHEFMRRL